MDPALVRGMTDQSSQRSWAQVTAESAPPPQPRESAAGNGGEQRVSWRQRLHLLEGAAGDSGQIGALSADVDIVAYNVAKNVTSVDLRNWLAQKGLYVKDCKLMTTSEEARSLSYKITLQPQDFDRATQDASLWPYRVRVILFKNFNRNAQRNDTNSSRSA